MAQFVYNNSFHSVINTALFMAAKSFMPYSGTKVLYEPEAVHTSNHNQELTDDFICKIAVLKTRCQQNIHYAQEHIAEQTNHHWNFASNYQVENIMWLNT